MSKASDDAIYYIDQAKDLVADVGVYKIKDIDDFVGLVFDYLNDALNSIREIEEKDE